ncbi:hypothetical protein E3P92_03219 [Wallemia ichthyophaga]|uniref:Vacuolar-sorting protein SNF8 n=1 Tax=Wallemia ichthyophaga TaxID=245174 RepID=A0A4T0EX39_WALIC|nr:hypothetical protein E3P98_03186 [Wallemia ichthyophaga]TIA89865.1 hypothetical protein E3P97_02811 [Wallemia ichthyophaga]TIA96738.1 hypothetical protein E3P95_03143 [Wallemia ichthyophaga]TIA97983.1 hypothetical protein E3P94_03103 [Wallemia ichthyophaga]TIB09526.1 hypothetical protein E3P93_03165 [Wallemia ichthyophaga]
MSRRNNKGIGSLHQQHHQNNDAYRSLGNSINAQQLQSIHHQISTFKQYLTDFSKNHRKDIESNVQFRNRFTEMCSTIDVDPLNISRGSLFSNLTGFSDFYLSLAVQLVDIDLQKSIKVLAPLHDNRHQYEIIPVNQILYMRSQPKELNNDMLSLLSLAHSNHGWIDQSLVQNAQSWTVERVRNSLRQAVMDDGILWIDNQAPQSRYYFPSLFQDIVQSLV